MKKAVLVWEMPMVMGTPSSPVMYLLYYKSAEKYMERFNRFCEEKGVDYEINLDETHGDVEKLLQDEIDLLIFAPGRKFRSFIYNKELRETQIPVYVLEEQEYRNGKVEKLLEKLKG